MLNEDQKLKLTEIKVSTEEEYLTCIRCGLCLYTCPVYRELLVETASPRGRVALIRAVAEGKLSLNGDYADRFYNCLLCAACSSVCPDGLEVDSLLLRTREELAARELLPPALRQLSEAILSCRNIAGEDNCRRLIWTENMARAPLGIGRRETAEIVYFVGCVSSFFPMSYSIGQSFVQTLEAAEVNYALLGEEECCCAYPLLVAGQRQAAEDLIHYNIRRVKATGASRVVVTCPSCYHIWRHVYPLIGGAEMDLEVFHATELLEELIGNKRLRLGKFPYRVTYHDPCDLGRKSGIYTPPRHVLNSIPGLTLVEMADNQQDSLCCGGGGSLETYDPELVKALSDRRLAQVQATGAQIVISSCQQCKRTLGGAIRRAKLRARAMDLTEVVWSAACQNESR